MSIYERKNINNINKLMITRYQINSIFKIKLIVVCGLFCFCLNGCKVKYSFSGASIAPEINTAAVEYFQNRAPLSDPSLSQSFTDALKDKFESQTRLIIVNGTGDVSFEGEIVKYDIQPTAITAQEVAAQNRLTISVKVKYTNSFDSELNFTKTFSRFEDVSSSVNISDITEDTLELIIEQIVQDIFNEAFVNW